MIKSIKNSQNLMEIPQNFMKNSQTLMKNSKKIHLSCFSPTSYQRRRIIGNFKNQLWCTMDETQGAKIQIWGTGHKLTSLRNSGNFILSIFMHSGQRLHKIFVLLFKHPVRYSKLGLLTLELKICVNILWGTRYVNVKAPLVKLPHSYDS